MRLRCGWGGGSAVELRARPPGALTPVWSSRKLCLHVTTALDSSPRLRAQVSLSVTHSLPLSHSLSLSVCHHLSLFTLHTPHLHTVNYIKYCIDSCPQHRLMPPRLTPFISPLSTHLSFTFPPYYCANKDVNSNTLQTNL